jgi:hypothetical protein
METRSFVILASNKSLVEDQIAKLNRRAIKLNLEQITVTFGKAYLDCRELIIQDPNDLDALPQYVKKEVLSLPVEITGPLDVSFDGWQFIATLQHLPTGENIIRSIANSDIPKEYRSAKSNCQHCNCNRYRKDTYLVRHTTGAVMQVGSTCIKSFLGGNSPDDILNRANFIAELLTFVSGCNGSFDGSGEPQYHINTFLAHTNSCIRDYGWLSKSKASIEGGTPTSIYVASSLESPRSYSKISDVDNTVAKTVAYWAENLSDDSCDKSDYLYNIRAIARSGMVERRTFGFAASMIAAYNKALSDMDQTKNSNHIGTIKSRITLNLTLKRQFSYSGSYGTSTKFIFADDNGNVLTWSTSSSKNLEDGKTYCIKGTIKKHGEYKGTKQTELSRCEIIV